MVCSEFLTNSLLVCNNNDDKYIVINCELHTVQSPLYTLAHLILAALFMIEESGAYQC